MEGSSEQGVVLATGRRAGDARMRLFVFAGELIALTVEGQGERAPALLLTREQAMRLQETLGELLPQLAEPARDSTNVRRAGVERRKASGSGELR